jgi:cytochrome c nitrite reductase small subunit
MKPRTIQGILLGVVIGVALGIGVYTFAYAKGWSYLTDDPAACANCHVMQEQFDGWLKSSHRSVATCNSCHTPSNLIGKYATKASNGFWHSFFFTTGGYEDNIQIKPHSRGDCVNHSRFLSGRSARNASRTKSPRGLHKSARLDFRNPARVSLHFLVENRRMGELLLLVRCCSTTCTTATISKSNARPARAA